MPVSDMPVWPGFLVHVLRVLADGRTMTSREVTSAVADDYGLTPEQRSETTSSGDVRYRGRIGFAILELRRAEAVDRPRRGAYVITAEGRELLKEHPDGLEQRDLLARTIYRDRVESERKARGAPARARQPDDRAEMAPVDQIAEALDRLHASVSADLLARLLHGEPEFLEQVVLDLLVAMGYGGVGGDRARRIGGSGDGGVDGVIDQDPLGLGRIYVQAKRYAPGNVVGRPAIQGFVGALHGRQAGQGVFITTSSFSREASEYAQQVAASVVLIDGARLAALMIQYGVGVQAENTYTVVKLDEDYFE